MVIKFWSINLNMGDGSTEHVRYQTRGQAKKAREKNSESQGEDWNETICADCIEVGEDGKIVLTDTAKEYLEDE